MSMIDRFFLGLSVGLLIAILYNVDWLKHSKGYIDEQLKTIPIWVDPDTMCQYLIPKNGGITPRLGTDGFPLCFNSLPTEDNGDYLSYEPK